jgi:hypothetical protein
MYPIGSIYMNAIDSSNPSVILGFGTWVAFGAGRVPVGFDGNDPLFNEAEKAGGVKDAVVVAHTHTFSGTTSISGEHSHIINASQSWSGTGTSRIANGNSNSDNAWEPTASAGSHTHTISGTTAQTGSTATNANLQPYITVYMWKRTA